MRSRRKLRNEAEETLGAGMYFSTEKVQKCFIIENF